VLYFDARIITVHIEGVYMQAVDLQSVNAYIEGLSGLRVREAVDTRIMWRDYCSGKYSDVKGALGLSCQLQLAKVSSGGPSGVPAWVNLPEHAEHIPLFGSRLFSESRFVVYVRKEFLFQRDIHEITCAFAHECCHIILESVRHPLRKEERAVDLAAMLLGFSEVYLQNVGSEPSIVERLWAKVSKKSPLYEGTTLGYLTPTEIRHAHSIITKMRRSRCSSKADE
jgi:hypothetical protein